MEGAVQKKSQSFAARVSNARDYLRDEKHEYTMSEQLFRCGTSVGALVSEAKYAESKADFIHKLKIALKEANEAKYWLKLLYKTKYLNQPTFSSLYADNTEILKLLISIINTTRKNLQNEAKTKK